MKPDYFVRILRGRAETRNFSSSVEKHFTSERSFRTALWWIESYKMLHKDVLSLLSVTCLCTTTTPKCTLHSVLSCLKCRLSAVPSNPFSIPPPWVRVGDRRHFRISFHQIFLNGTGLEMCFAILSVIVQPGTRRSAILVPCNSPWSLFESLLIRAFFKWTYNHCVL